MLSAEKIDYCPLYCEENIWHLCQLEDFAQTQTYVLFISNPTKSCAMWQQKSASSLLYPVVWDYHVVLLVKAQVVINQQDDNTLAKNSGWRVYDLDSLLPLGIELDEYLRQSFSPPLEVNEPQVKFACEFHPCFKLVCGKIYAEKFSSDRKHMHNQNGSWVSPPPLWPVIIGDQALSLQRLTDMTCGEVHTLSALKSTLVDLL